MNESVPAVQKVIVSLAATDATVLVILRINLCCYYLVKDMFNLQKTAKFLHRKLTSFIKGK